MKAIEMHGYGGVDQLRYEDVPAPKPGPNDVLVKVAATSVNPIDWKIRRGDMKGIAKAQFPVIPGRDVAGEVVEVGSKVAKWKPGDKVMGIVDGSYAELVSAPSDVLSPIPQGLDTQQAGVLPLVITTGAELIDHIAPKRGETVLITGALGSVARTAVYAAKQRGAHVIAGVRESQKKEAESLGVDRVIALDNDREIQSLPELDAIGDTVSGDVIGKLIPKLKRGGVLGSVLGKPKAAEGKDIRVETFRAEPNPESLLKFAEAVRDGAYTIPVARKFKISEAPKAQALSEQGGIEGKLMLVP